MIDAVIDVHLTGPLFISQPAFRAMREASFGRIVADEETYHQPASLEAATKFWPPRGQANRDRTARRRTASQTMRRAVTHQKGNSSR